MSSPHSHIQASGAAVCRAVVRRPWLTILATVLLTAAFALQLPRLARDETTDTMLPESDEVLRYTRQMEEVFGHDEFVIVAVISPDPFTAETVAKVVRLSRDLEFVPGVSKVISATNVKNFRGDAGSVWTEPLVDPYRLPATPDELGAYRALLLGSDLFVGNLVSPEGTALGIVARLDAGADKRALVAAVEAAAARHRGPEEIVVSGSPAINVQVGRAMGRDMGRFFPLAVAVVLLSLLLAFGTVRGTVLPFLALLLTIVWTLGTMALLGARLSVIDTMLPTLLMAIGCSYAIHIMTEYYEVGASEAGQRERVVTAMGRISPTIAGVGLTTVIGFLALRFNDTPIVRQFGLFAAVGVGYGVVLCTTFLPAALALTDDPRARRGRWSLGGSLGRVLGAVGSLDRRRPRVVLAVALLLVAGSVAALPRLRVETNAVGFFRAGDPVRTAIATIGRHFGGTIPLRTIVDTGRPGGVFEPGVLAAIEDYQAFLGTIPEVGKTVSVVDYVRDTNLALHGGDRTHHALPGVPGRAAQYWFLHSLGSDPDDVRSLIDEEASAATVTARLRQVSAGGEPLGTRRTAEIVRDLEEYAARRFPPGVTVAPVGRARDIVRTSDYLVAGFLRSVAGAAVPVGIVAALLFRSAAGGLISLVPPALAIVLAFGVMGWLRVPLDIATTLIASLALGIGIDDTLHFILRCRARLHAGGGAGEAAMEEVVRDAGAPILTSSAALAAGFAVLTVATFKPVAWFGGLTALVMVLTPLAALFVLPALLVLLRPRFLRR